MVEVNLSGVDSLPQAEIDAYIQRGKAQNPHKDLTKIDICVDGDFVDLSYHYDVPFDRIRRITGYLVGTTSRWNNAKKAELNDRTKHNI